MRILQINTEKTWRGGERQTVYTIEGLLDAGVEVGLVCRDNYPLHKSVRDLPVTIHPARNTADAVRVTSTVGRTYDLIHAQSAKGQSIAVLSKPLHNRPILYTRRVNFKPHGFSSVLKYNATDRTVAISTAIRDTLIEFGVRDVEIISSAVKPRDLDTDRARNLLESLHVPHDTNIVGWVGDLVPQKDPRLLVETVRELAKRRQDFVVVQCGNDQMGDKVRAGIENFGLQDRLRLLGHIDGVEDLYALFTVFLVTGNRTEGLNSSVYDAFAHNVPVVSTLTGGMRDSVADRGLTCPHSDPICLADHVSRLLDDAALRASMADKARQWALDNVTLPAIAKRYLAVYNDMLARSSG
ncbi:glycosyltransferase family 4 protein [bacterium]|nr:glycosyltransferase family 4 protein [bacterium]